MKRKQVRKELAIGIAPKGVFVVKVQIPLGGDTSQAMIYNKDKSFMMFWPMDKFMKSLMGKDIKKYFYAKKVDDQIEIGDETEVNDW